jgi:large subunit ribosomal protein L30
MKLAVIRIRGITGVRKDIANTMRLLRLYRKNYCVVLEDTKTNLGMLKKVKDYVTWGELDEESYKTLIKKRGQEHKGRTMDSKKKVAYKFMKHGDKSLKPFFRLSPPKGGFERKGIKKQFTAGGALGYRGKKINDLIKKMV